MRGFEFRNSNLFRILITEIKQRLDIVELVSEYVTLQKAGRNFKGLCPFHSEKHASFFVFPEQQSWHCFGACGTGGDIFSFIMKKEGIDFGQALRLLAQKGGITLSPIETSDKARDEKKERLFQINESAAEYYHHLLLKRLREAICQKEMSNTRSSKGSVSVSAPMPGKPLRITCRVKVTQKRS